MGVMILDKGQGFRDKTLVEFDTDNQVLFLICMNVFCQRASSIIGS